MSTDASVSGRLLSEAADRATDRGRSALRKLAGTMAAALAVTLAQILLVLAVSPAASWAEAYRSLCQWDGWLYANIAQQGYHSSIPPRYNDIHDSNVAFFPGYPLVGCGLSQALGISVPSALVLAAHLAAWGAWTYLLLFFTRWRTPPRVAALATLVLAAHPAAFFLVVAYSESLFLFGLLGFLFWVTADRPAQVDGNGSPPAGCRWLAAVFQGGIMTATRLGGIPVAFCPALAPLVAGCLTRLGAGPSDQASRQDGKPSQIGPWLIGLLASLAGLAFFGYCQLRFGAWNLYMQAQFIGWGVSADWLWWLRPNNYLFLGSWMFDNVLWPDDLSRLTIWLTWGMFAALAVIEFRAAQSRPTAWRRRIVFYLAALTLFFLHAAGVSPILMKSMLRYSFSVHALLLLVALDLANELSGWRHLSRAKLRWLLAGCAASLILQGCLAWRFLHLEWVA